MAKRRMPLILRLYRYALPHKSVVVLTLVAGMGLTLTQLGFISLIRPFFDKGVRETNPAQAWEAIRHVGIWLILLTPAMGFFTLLTEYLSTRTVWVILVDIRNALCDALLPQSVGYFESRRSGDFMSRLTNDVNATQMALRFLFQDFWLQPLTLLAALAYAMTISWQMTIISLVSMTALAWPIKVLGKKVRRAGRKGLEGLADLTDAMHQMFSGIRIVKAFSMEKAESQEFRRRNHNFFRRMCRMARARASSQGLTEFVGSLSVAAFAIGGGYLASQNYWHMTWGKWFSLGGAAMLMYNAMRKLAKGYNNLNEALSGAERIFEIADHEPEIQDAPDAIAVDGVREGVAFRHVWFAYNPQDAPVLCDIDFEVRCGETVAIVGKSGAGKSTLVDLIPRFYDPSDGCVALDGVDLRKIKHASLMALVSVVSQQTFLFNRTILENIRYGRPDADDDEVRRAAEAANADEFIRAQPDGYDTTVGEFGVRLSGGQRQRIAIARAILKDAPFLILDEAMVGLDSESETLVREAMIHLMEGRTTFVIAHDFTTIQHAGRILVLKDGKLVEMGTHAELMSREGEYRRLRMLHMVP